MLRQLYSKGCFANGCRSCNDDEIFFQSIIKLKRLVNKDTKKGNSLMIDFYETFEIASKKLKKEQ